MKHTSRSLLAGSKQGDARPQADTSSAKNKGLVALVLSACLLFALVGCGTSGNDSGGTDTSGSANVANPVVDVESPEAINKQLQTNLEIPAEATIDRCSIIDDSLGEVVFSLNGKSYTYRVMNTDTSEDISGLYYDFTSHSEVDIAGVSCVIDYNDGGPGYCRWFDDIAKTTYSVSVDSGASEEVLTEIATTLIAEQRLM